MSVAYLEKLNPGQRRAVEHGVGEAHAVPSAPLLVIAGAGTGKTNTLAHRVAHLIVNGTDPYRILLMTFSRRAAGEMNRRVERIVRQVSGDRAGASLRRSSARPARSAIASSWAAGSWLRTITPTLSRISANMSRSLELALMTEATGLFSSWVRPAVTVPRATSRSRVLTVCWDPIPWMANPSSMWVAIGNHSRTAQPKSSAESTTSSPAAAAASNPKP